MEKQKGIYAKLLKFQEMNISIKRTSVGGHHQNKYANIDEVLEKVKPALTKCGVLLTQTPNADGLNTYLIDTEDGSAIKGFLPFVNAADAQKIGSNMTYMRRYSIVSMLGLEAEDDDGQVASTPTPTSTVRR